MCVCLWCAKHELTLSTDTLSQVLTCMWVVGVFCPGPVLSRGAGTLFDLKSIIMHLNNLACMWTNYVGMICWS